MKGISERTLAIWQPHTTRELTGEDARQIVENVTGLFAVLIEWGAANQLIEAAQAEADHTPPQKAAGGGP